MFGVKTGPHRIDADRIAWDKATEIGHGTFGVVVKTTMKVEDTQDEKEQGQKQRHRHEQNASTQENSEVEVAIKFSHKKELSPSIKDELYREAGSQKFMFYNYICTCFFEWDALAFVWFVYLCICVF